MPASVEMISSKLIHIEIPFGSKRDFNEIILLILNKNYGKHKIIQSQTVIYKTFGISFLRTFIDLLFAREKHKCRTMFLRRLQRIQRQTQQLHSTYRLSI